MKHIIDQRQQVFLNQWSNRCIALELLLTGTAEQIHTEIKQLTNLDIPPESIDQVVTAWRSLHWDNTRDWEYSNIFSND